MTLFTQTLLSQLKTHFGLRMNWVLGVTRLQFRIEDGKYPWTYAWFEFSL